MAQKTNLNISPYYDDFDSENNFYKVLFNPGRPVQSRELTTLQSILQNQLESFGSNIFKEGSMVIPGNITYDGQFYAVKLNPTNFGVDISVYIKYFIGKSITGQSSGSTASIQYVAFPDQNEVEELTIYVKYKGSDNNFTFNQFKDGESLIANETVVYGNTTINAGTPFASLISSNATSIGSAVSIGKGVYFVRGYFVTVDSETIILDHYTNTPSYRVGLKIDELIITAKDDETLYDNAKGFTNYAAPGADRFKIKLSLTKKLLDDLNDTDFIELLRVKDGQLKKIETKTQYATIRDYLAERTYDESGDYSIDPFIPSIHNSLNDRLGSNGLFFDNEKTDEGNTPSEDLMCVKVSPGKSYVKGYDVKKIGTTILDVSKPRDTETISQINIPFDMGNVLRVNNVSGALRERYPILLKDRRVGDSSSTIGDARVYTYALTDAAYSSPATNWDLYLYDIQTYTKLTLNSAVSNTELPQTSFVKGKSSGASGYAVSSGGGSSTISLRQTSGSFLVGEQIIINGLDFPRTIKSIAAYSTKDIKSVYQDQESNSFPTFTADTLLENFPLPNGINQITIATDGTITSNGVFFTGIKIGDIIKYQKSSSSVPTFNRVSYISQTQDSIKVTLLGSAVSNVCDNTLPGSTLGPIFAYIGAPVIRNNGKLYTQLPDSNISSVNLTNSTLPISGQIVGETTNGSGILSFDISQISNNNNLFFQAFNEDKYAVHYSNGGIGTITSDRFSLSNNVVTITGLTPSQSGIVVDVSLVKSGIQSKIKTYNRSKVLNVSLSKYQQSGSNSGSSINDGLTFNQFYGLRIQDEEICLNVPDVSNVIAVYESLDTSSPVLDTIQVNSSANVSANAIIGENIFGTDSKSIARVVTKPSSNVLGIIYLNEHIFSEGESIVFKESNITTNIEVITPGKYKNITDSYILNKGQKDQYYDYSKIVRTTNTTEPSKQLLIVFDYYSVPSNDTGDVFTVLSYDAQRYQNDIPRIGPQNVRGTDTLDFRPRVSEFTITSASPFDFSQRDFTTDSSAILSPNESSILGYSYYLGRIDKLFVDKFGSLIVQKGVSAKIPKEPNKNMEVMDIATITLPPYLYNPQDAVLSLNDNRRYTMRDIGLIENRVGNLERVTSLSLLELNTKTLQIQDANGNNRFKSGFFVDDFKNYDLINTRLSRIQINPDARELSPIVSRYSLKGLLSPATQLTDEEIDLSNNYDLLDPNVQKTGNSVTLKYNSVGWIEQAFATTVENVNPFHVILYKGTILLHPAEDHWIRTVQLPDRHVTHDVTVHLDLGTIAGQNTSSTVNTGGGNRVDVSSVTTQINNEIRNSSSNTDTTSQNVFVGSYLESFMRSRNTEFFVSNVRPGTQHYQFLDGNSGVDFVPKLIEIASDSSLSTYGASKGFQIGETVIGIFNQREIISFRVASGNHKSGPYNNPTTTYQINPYIRAERLTSDYNSSSKVLNVDTFALSDEAQGRYTGYLTVGTRLIGQSSGAVAYVKDLRLISDNYGDIIGTFFLRDPNADPVPTVRIETGKKTYRLSSSSTNEQPLPGSTSISSAEEVYVSEGTVEQFQNVITTTNTTTNTLITQSSTDTVTTARYYDPLAQSFVVGGNIEAPNPLNNNDDVNGAFLTAVDLFFAAKATGNNPVKVEIRTVELGTPTRTVIGKPKILRPEDISISNNAEVATHVVFDSPIFLNPGREYAVVIISDSSDEYELWTAIMGERTVNTTSLPDASAVKYSTQFALGSLFKSQNGTIWTASQNQDLKFKLYKAEFTSNTGTAFFNNPTLDVSNGYVKKLNNNPLTTLPKECTLGITTVYNSPMITLLSQGRKVGESTKTYNYGYIVGTGSSVSSVGITTGGKNYVSDSSVNTFAITGKGSGLVLNISATNGLITGTPTIVSPGNGYAVGDSVGIVTSSAGNTGTGAVITITGNSNSIDRLYLSNVQGGTFTQDGSANLVIYNDSGSRVSLGNTFIRSYTASPNLENAGNFLRVNHFDHGMYSKTNQLKLQNIRSDVAPVQITAPLTTQSTISVAIGDTANFGTFEGLPVSTSNPGYVKINNELIKYESVGSGLLNLGSSSRGIDSTISINHEIGSLMYKYELGGVSLRRINTTHDISDTDISLDGYYIEFDRTSAKGVDRSSDSVVLPNTPQLSFISNNTLGGSEVLATQNIQYNGVVPNYGILNPGSLTSVSANIRTVSGTSVSGNEVSFIDNGYEPVELNKLNLLNSTRIVCSKENETAYLSGLPRNKSFTTTITLNTRDKNLSPLIFLDNTSTEFYNNRLDSPVSDYANDGRVNSIRYDPHSAIYVSKTINLTNPANSLKVILSAYRPESSDFRVLYNLIRADSSEVPQSFELFPGYGNLTYNSNGKYVSIDPSKNNGLPDTFVRASSFYEFLEYDYTADNLDLFTGFTIKIVMSGTNQANAPIIKELRVIATR